MSFTPPEAMTGKGDNFAKLSPFPVIASGGVKDINDLKNLSKIPNVIGAICGVSLYENKINFKEALEMF